MIELIEISTIKTNNKYLRLNTDIEKLKKSIETVGPIHPLVVNEENELIAGGRRYSALKELGHKKVAIIRATKNHLEQELVSIDENLIRKDLTKIELEQSLSRARELYEQLYPSATKYTQEDLTDPESNLIQVEKPNDERSFVDLTAEKTGLSKRVIKSAIEREEKASNVVKQLRSHGELNASQTNEIIKLSKNDQEHIAGLIKSKSAKEVKELVKRVSEDGLQSAVKELVNAPQLPKEYKGLKVLFQRANKLLAKILLEEINSEHEDVHSILDQMSTLRLSLDQFLVLCTSSKDTPTNPQGTSTQLDSVVSKALKKKQNDDFPELEKEV